MQNIGCDVRTDWTALSWFLNGEILNTFPMAP